MDDGPPSADGRPSETTRHFVATVYVVNDGATALHYHDRLGLWLPPGGHLERDELPTSAAVREVREELGLAVDLVGPSGGFDTATVSSLPQPQHVLLEDIHDHADGTVGHQHVDFVYYGAVPSRDIRPADGEQDAEDWRWLTADDVDARTDLEPDVRAIATAAIEAVDGA
jgi:8-oxo-dGTP pyrophosphatase MutT (NUDIX family)